MSITMPKIGLVRIQRELKDALQSDEETKSMVSFAPKEDSLLEMRGEIVGPRDTPYEGGRFVLDITIPEAYPFKPPVVKFVTKVWHPNISSATGAICLDILSKNWAASITIRAVLLSLLALLESPVPDDPQDAVVAKQYRKHQETFKKTARHWASVYAGGSKTEPALEERVHELSKTGYSEDVARVALSNSNWKMANAIASLKD